MHVPPAPLLTLTSFPDIVMIIGDATPDALPIVEKMRVVNEMK
jgi:hypothetical protein